MVRNAGLDIPGNDVGTLELDKDTPGGPLRPRNIRAIVGSRRGTRVTPGSGMLTEATKYTYSITRFGTLQSYGSRRKP